VQQHSRGVRNRDAKKKLIKSILCCSVHAFIFRFQTQRTAALAYGSPIIHKRSYPHNLFVFTCVRYYNIIVYVRVCMYLFVRARDGAYTITPIRHSTNFPDRCLLGRRNMMRNRLRRRRSRSLRRRRRRRRRPGARPTPLLIKPHVPPTRLVSATTAAWRSSRTTYKYTQERMRLDNFFLLLLSPSSSSSSLSLSSLLLLFFDFLSCILCFSAAFTSITATTLSVHLLRITPRYIIVMLCRPSLPAAAPPPLRPRRVMHTARRYL